MKSKKELILNNVKDLVVEFLYYDRREDEDLPLGEIQKQIEELNITPHDIVECFSQELTKNLLPSGKQANNS